jgi:polar amino acid transport system substrate-binding protein
MRSAIWSVFVISCLTACGEMGQPSERNTSMFRIGYSIEPPYSYLNKDGRLTGYSVDVVNRITSALGIKNIQWTLLPFSELIPSLREGSINMIGTHLFASEQRLRQVRFAEPGAWVCSGLLINPDIDEAPIADREDLRYVVIRDSAEHSYLQSTPAARQLTVVPDTHLGVKALQQGHGDLLALSMPTVTLLSGQTGTGVARYASPGETSKKLAIPISVAFRKQDEELAKRWNRAQRQVAEELSQELADRYSHFLYAESGSAAEAVCQQAFRQQQAGNGQQDNGHG